MVVPASLVGVVDAVAAVEAAEETGVDPAAVEPLILLPRLHIAPSRFDVTGCSPIGARRRRSAAIDPAETSGVMRVPFTALADPGNRIMLSTSFGWHGPAFVLERAVVWGYTGETSPRWSALEVGRGRGLLLTRSISTGRGGGRVRLPGGQCRWGPLFADEFVPPHLLGRHFLKRPRVCDRRRVRGRLSRGRVGLRDSEQHACPGIEPSDVGDVPASLAD